MLHSAARRSARESDVREIVFALEFRGKAGPIPGSGARRRARSTAPSQAMRTMFTGDGMDVRVEPVVGESAVLESEVERFADGTFVETGTITYGALGTVSFETLGRGVVGESGIPGWAHGAVVWTITGGTGGCEAARGLITSNFAVSASGEVVDHHVARIVLPAAVALA
jgi:hypothetical protein